MNRKTVCSPSPPPTTLPEPLRAALPVTTFIHYQKTENGVISANLFTDRSSNSDSIRALIDSIQPLTEHAVEYSE